MIRRPDTEHFPAPLLAIDEFTHRERRPETQSRLDASLRTCVKPQARWANAADRRTPTLPLVSVHKQSPRYLWRGSDGALHRDIGVQREVSAPCHEPSDSHYRRAPAGFGGSPGCSKLANRAPGRERSKAKKRMQTSGPKHEPGNESTRSREMAVRHLITNKRVALIERLVPMQVAPVRHGTRFLYVSEAIWAHILVNGTPADRHWTGKHREFQNGALGERFDSAKACERQRRGEEAERIGAFMKRAHEFNRRIDHERGDEGRGRRLSRHDQRLRASFKDRPSVAQRHRSGGSGPAASRRTRAIPV